MSTAIANHGRSARTDKAKDQVVAALRWHLDEMKQRLASKDRDLHGKQREIDRLYGKLAVASPFISTELRIACADILNCLAQQEKPAEEANER